MNGSDSFKYVIFLCVSCTALAFLIAYIILSLVFGKQLAMRQRLEKMFVRKQYAVKIEKKKKKKNGDAAAKAVHRQRFTETITNELLAADIIMRAEEFATIWLVLAFVPAGLILIASGNAVAAVIAMAAGVALPLVYVAWKKKKHVEDFDRRLSDALMIICNCLRSGLTFQQAMDNIAKEMNGPIAKEFSRVCSEIRYGSTVEKALNAMCDRVPSRDLQLAVSAVNIQRQTGGNLSSILETISETINARIKLKKEIKVLTSTGRISGIVISMLPLIMAVIMMLLSPEYFINFVKTDIGKTMLLIGGIMECAGVFVVKRIVSIKY